MKKKWESFNILFLLVAFLWVRLREVLPPTICFLIKIQTWDIVNSSDGFDVGIIFIVNSFTTVLISKFVFSMMLLISLVRFDFMAYQPLKVTKYFSPTAPPPETVAAIMMVYKNTKVKVRSPNGDANYFNIIAVELRGDTLAPYLFIICLEYVLRKSIDLMKENGFKLAKEEAEDTPHKQLRTRTTPMTWCFWQIHPSKPKPCYTVWNEQLVA